MGDTRPDGAKNATARKIVVLELGPGAVLPGPRGQLRCASLLPVRLEPIPLELERAVRPRSRWWAPAYGGC